MKKQFRDYNQARKFIHTLKLKNEKEWMEYKRSGKKPNDIPASPNMVYKNKGWIGLGDWVGTGRVANQNQKFKKIKDTIKISQKLGLQSRQEWYQYVKKHKLPDGVPRAPDTVYKKTNEWTSWGDWLGTGYVHKKEFRNYNDAKKFVHSLKLLSQAEWIEYCKSGKKPGDIPRSPREVYKKEFEGMQQWLGYKTRKVWKKNSKSFEGARKFIHTLKLKNQREWKEYCKSGKKPEDIPFEPKTVYKKEWKNLGDWLGNGTVQNQQMEFRDFKEARKYARKIGLKNITEWREYCKAGKKPKDIRADPRKYSEYTGIGDWLGTGNIAQRDLVWLPKEEAIKIVRDLAKKYNLRTKEDWKVFVKNNKLPSGIPKHPWAVYAKVKRKYK